MMSVFGWMSFTAATHAAFLAQITPLTYDDMLGISWVTDASILAGLTGVTR